MFGAMPLNEADIFSALKRYEDIRLPATAKHRVTKPADGA
jgi:hypothetical protein